MAVIKSYTDIEQSHKLAKILPIESADKHWIILDGAILRATTYDYFDLQEYNQDKGTFREYTPCWSLAALLEVLPNENMLVKTTDSEYYCLAKDIMTKHYNNPIDACYEMVLELKRKELL